MFFKISDLLQANLIFNDNVMPNFNIDLWQTHISASLLLRICYIPFFALPCSKMEAW